LSQKETSKADIKTRSLEFMEETRTFTVVTVTFVGHCSWIKTFNSEAALREYLIEEMNMSDDSHDEADYVAMSLEEVIDKTVDFFRGNSLDGTTNEIVAIMEGGKCILYEFDHSGEKSVQFSRSPRPGR
jgi:hypothetical protein